VVPVARLVGTSLLLAGCHPAPLGLRPSVAELLVDNPERLPVALDVVDGDGCRQIASLGSSGTHRVDLLAGTYVVRALTAHGPVTLPAPLLPSALPGGVLRVTIRTPPATASADPDFAFVPAGPAVIGDTLGIGQEDERPARIVDVPAFWLARREVTNAEFAAFLTASGPDVDSRWCAFDSRKCLVARDASTGAWTTAAPTLPVVTVSLHGALAYCAWRTTSTGVHHRLPSEVEWEKAARGPASLVFAYGNVYRRAAANQESGALRAVAAAATEGFGTADMTGNAFEWTSDAYRRAGDPDAPGQSFQVLRGGSFVLDGVYLRNSFRMKQRPDVRTDDIGFRVARDCPDHGPQ
jgi:formylglycine-generating enzyme required for sulfatase activity